MTDPTKPDLQALSDAATASSREMAGELLGRIGVKTLIEIWERHQTDVQAWAKAVEAKHQEEMDALRADLAAPVSQTRAEVDTAHVEEILCEALNSYTAWMLDDDYNAGPVLDRTIAHIRSALDALSPPPPHRRCEEMDPTAIEPEEQPDERDPYSQFESELAGLINSHSLENRTNTPDFILAQYLTDTLRALERHHYATKHWHEPRVQKPSDPGGVA